MFGKRNQDNPAEKADLAVDTMPRPEPAPAKVTEEPVIIAAPPPTKTRPKATSVNYKPAQKN